MPSKSMLTEHEPSFIQGLGEQGLTQMININCFKIASLMKNNKTPDN